MTTFKGSFVLDKTLTSAHQKYLEAFSKTRRVKRDTLMLSKFPDQIRENVNLPLGEDGCYFVGAFKSTIGIVNSVISYEDPPQDQPSIWCRWTPDEDGDTIVWNQNPNFEAFVPWIEYIILHFIQPWGYKLNGSVKWSGNEKTNAGKITIKNNKVEVLDLSVFA